MVAGVTSNLPPWVRPKTAPSESSRQPVDLPQDRSRRDSRLRPPDPLPLEAPRPDPVLRDDPAGSSDPGALSGDGSDETVVAGRSGAWKRWVAAGAAAVVVAAAGAMALTSSGDGDGDLRACVEAQGAVIRQFAAGEVVDAETLARVEDCG